MVARFYIPLPELEARRRIITKLMGRERHKLTEEQVEDVSRQDLMAALRQVKASVGHQNLELYKEWDKQYGAGR